MIGISRVYHGVHTVDQILNGWIWGFGVYMLFAEVWYYRICVWVHSVNKKKWYQLLWNTGTKVFILFYVSVYSAYFVGSNINPVDKEWIEKLN